MRFIHLADVHLGAVPDRGCPWSSRREEEIWETFRRVIAGIRENPVDLLFIAGDLFHRQPLLRELKEVNNLFSTIPDTRVYLMAGNHDYIKADSFYRDFQWEKNVTFFKNEQLTCVKDEKLDVYVYGLSYEHQEIENPLYDSIHPAEGEGVHILLAHGGDAKHIPMNIKSIAASGFDYIALGHIHRPQSLSEKVRYCGSPLKYSFSEAKYDKTVTIVDADDFSVQTIALKPLHDMRMIKGSIENILSKEVINAADSDDYLHITLTDKDNIIDAMDKVRSAYPNVMQLEFERDMKGNTKGVYEATGVGTKPDNELFYDFYKLQNGVEIDSEKAELVDSILEEVKEN